MLTTSLLIGLASATSFERGEDLYMQGAIRRLVKRGEVYEAEVQGTFRYHQTWDLRGEEPVAVCSCPYDFGGICKHLVAAGLAIVAREFVEEEVVEKSPEPVDPNFFAQSWEPAEDRLKAQFLRQVFAKRAEMRTQFLRFSRQEGPGPSFEEVDRIRKEVNKALRELGFDYETDLNRDEFYDHPDTYYDEGMLLERAAARKIERVFEPYVHRLRVYLDDGNLLDVLKVVLGLYEARFDVSEPGYDEYDAFYDYPEQIFAVYQLYPEMLLEGISHTVISYPLSRHMIQLIFERWSHYEYRFRKGGGDRYELTAFFPILQALVFDDISAQQLDTRLQGYQLFGPEFAPLHLHISQFKKDPGRWVETAEAAYTQDEGIARKLLAYYQKADDEVNFLRVAREAYAAFPQSLVPYIFQYLTQEQDPELYKALLEVRLAQTHSLDLFRRWSTLASEEEVTRLIKSFAGETDWYIALLTEADRKQDILNFAKKALTPWNMLTVLPPIIETYPAFCFEVLEKQVEKLLVKASKRETYQQACHLMGLALQAPGYEQEARKLIGRMYAFRRPSLKEEIRQAGLLLD